MLLEVLLSNSLCFMNTAILCKEHAIFFVLPAKNLLMLNKKIEAKLSSYSCGSAGWFA